MHSCTGAWTHNYTHRLNNTAHTHTQVHGHTQTHTHRLNNTAHTHTQTHAHTHLPWYLTAQQCADVGINNKRKNVCVSHEREETSTWIDGHSGGGEGVGACCVCVCVCHKSIDV